MDFRAQLADQLRFIQTSCAAYDAGDAREAVRIATSLRVLFHQTKNQTSLLTHLGATSINLLSTCDVPRRPTQPYFPAMTYLELDPPNYRFEYMPKLQVDYQRPVPFNDWWFREIVYLSKPDRLEIKRKDLVLGAADKDGGAHVDKKLEPQYERVLEGLGVSMTVNPDNMPSQHVPCKHGHLAALRQMGYEVLHSPELLALT